MKKVVFLGSKHFGEKNDIRILAESCKKRLGDDIEIQTVYLEDLLFHISDTERTVKDVNSNTNFQSDLVIAVNWYKQELRDIAFTLALYLQEKSIPFWNSEMAEQRSSTKLSAMWQLAQLTISIPDTYFALDPSVLKRCFVHKRSVVKDIAGSRGRNNFLISNRKSLDNLLDYAPPSSRYMIQEYIPNDYDVRVICFAGEPSFVLKRQRLSDDTHLNNTSQGAKGTLLELNELPTGIIDQARRTAQTMKREIAGIDYLVANDGSNRYICLEVNAVPQLTSGTYTDQKMDALATSITTNLEK